MANLLNGWSNNSFYSINGSCRRIPDVYKLSKADVVPDADKTVTWTLSGNTSSNTSVDANGVVTIASDEKATSIKATATSNEKGAIVGTSTITIKQLNAPGTVTKITKSKKASVDTGDESGMVALVLLLMAASVVVAIAAYKRKKA